MPRHNKMYVLGSTHGISVLLRMATPVKSKDGLCVIQIFMIYVICRAIFHLVHQMDALQYFPHLELDGCGEM